MKQFRIFCLFIPFACCLFFITVCRHPADSTQPDTSSPTYDNAKLIADAENSGLPLLEINTVQGESITSKSEYVQASFKLTNPSDSTYSEIQLDEISIKGRGNTSWSQPKKPYTLKLAEKTEVLGMPKSKKWVLIANYSDKSLLRNQFASILGNAIYTNMTWNPSFQPVELILNGNYEGTYLLGEQIKIEKNRVNIQNVADTAIGKGDDLNGDGVIDEKDGGFIFEVNTTRMDEAYNYRTTRGIGMSLKDPDVEDFEGMENSVESYMSGIIQTCEDVLYSENWLDSDIGYRNYLDTDSFIDWYLVNEIAKNNDACWFSSVYLYYDPKDGKIHMGPDWDFDIGFGNIDYGTCNNYENFYIMNSGWHKRLFEDPEFVEQMKNRWNETKTSLFAAINTTIQKQADYLAKSAELNFTRWPILGSYVWPNPSGYSDRKTYQSEVDYLISWLNKRYTWLDSAINSL